MMVQRGVFVLKRFQSTADSLKTWSQQIKKQRWRTDEEISPSHANFLTSTLRTFFPRIGYVNGSGICPETFHFIFNNAHELENALGADGYDNFQAPPGYRRRMWVGGKIDVLNQVHFHKVRNCEEKVQFVRSMGESLFIGINREFSDENGANMIEQRILVYTNEQYKSKKEEELEKFNSSLSETVAQSDFFKISALAIFRFSALTFNSHKIHYDPIYAKSEGFLDVIVQGPFTVTIIMNWFALTIASKIKSVKYKNVKPIYQNQKIKIKAQSIAHGRYKVCIVDEEDHIYIECNFMI